MAAADFKRIFEALHTAVVLADAGGAIAHANAAFVELATQDARTLPGTDLAGLFAPDDRRRVQQSVVRVATGKSASAQVEARLCPHGIVTRWTRLGLQPWIGEDDRPAGVVAVVTDIGPQRETEAALDLVNARSLALADAMPLAMLVETEPGDVELANEALCRLLGLDSAPQSLSGLPVREALARSPFVDVGALGRVWAQTGRSAFLPLELPGDREVALVRHPIWVEDGPAGAVWVAREAQAAEGPVKGPAEIALIEKIGQELSVALEGLATVSIRAERMGLDPALVEHFHRIRGSAETAMGAIGDLVDFSSLSGGIVLRTQPFRLRSALAQLIARVVPGAEERGSQLRLKVEQDVADALEGDVERLQLVLRNLVEAALAIAPRGEVMLQVTPEYMTDSGIQLSFAVLLAGGSPTAKASADGGMGVAVARFMVAAMGGTLSVATRPGPEALYAFTIGFPVRPSPPTPARPTYATLVGMPVLVVATEPAQRSSVSEMLRGWRMLPLEADNASMALALLERLEQEGTRVPLVIVSNRLPVQDGFLLAFRIRNHPQLEHTLVMMLATEGRPGDAIACRENGIAAYMRYPIAARQLNEAIAAVTGASVDAHETPTLVTRHSLREQRKGATILLVDAHRDTQILAAHILGRQDCSVVAAQDLEEAFAALDQDVYDLVLVETSLEGLRGDDAATILRSRMGRDRDRARIVAITTEHSREFQAAKTAIGFDATLAKPFRREDLLGLLDTVRKATTG